MTDEQRQIKKLKQGLKDLILACDQTLEGIDNVMSKRKDIPNDVGKNIALCSNHLNMERDKAQHFALGIDFKDKRFYYKKYKTVKCLFIGWAKEPLVRELIVTDNKVNVLLNDRQEFFIADGTNKGQYYKNEYFDYIYIMSTPKVMKQLKLIKR